MSGVEVMIEDLADHPKCPHGPTLLFSRMNIDVRRNFYACAACRDRKLCPFFLYEDEKDKVSQDKSQAWEEERRQYIEGINHEKLFKILKKIKSLPQEQRMYCHTCSKFSFSKSLSKHDNHKISKNLTDHQLNHPSELLEPLENVKKEAQFLFSQNSVKTITKIFKGLDYKKVISMGTPRLHEFMRNGCDGDCQMESLLLDLDKRYHNFHSPLEFSWYNSFNHHFFLPESKQNFKNFIKLPKTFVVPPSKTPYLDQSCISRDSTGLVLVLDPPFGGRVEPLAQTIATINKEFQQVNGNDQDLPVFWIFPYFMEPQILNSLPNFRMLDYKVDYNNHPLFQDGPRGRKQGSPVRIFTNVDPQKIELPQEEGYKFCESCRIWVSLENHHCEFCQKCTSKDGRTYTHCQKCRRCVKPTWKHCATCRRCAQPDHKCQVLEFVQNCFHCKGPGHKKRDCPEIDHLELHAKRKRR